MNKTINYKTKTKFIKRILKQENIKELEKQSVISKLSFKKKTYADVYFHQGELDNEAIENIQNTKKIIVNSNTLKEKLLSKIDISEEKIEVIYPPIDVKYKKPKEVKKEFCEKYEIDPTKELIFFTAKNMKTSGLKEFINIVINLNYKYKMAVIAGDKKQIYNLKFQLKKYDLGDKLLLVEDYENMDDLFLASDVFLLPTYNTNFAPNILRAMYCKCAVFTTVNNTACEVVDVYSTMSTPEDGSMQFKLDALLHNKADLKLIKNQNRDIAKKYTLDKALEKFNKILEDI
jgi:glycosyltransferase involved in cell wall biosynthesis